MLNLMAVGAIRTNLQAARLLIQQRLGWFCRLDIIIDYDGCGCGLACSPKLVFELQSTIRQDPQAKKLIDKAFDLYSQVYYPVEVNEA